MRIAMLIDVYGKFAGGGQYHVRHLSQQLKLDHACEIDILSQNHGNMLYRFFWALWVIPLVIIRNLANHYDLVHSHGYIAGLSGKILSILLGIPVIHTVHGSNLMDLNDMSLKGRLERYLLTGICYDAQITVSRSFVSYPNKTKRIEVITNGINIGKNEKSKMINDKKTRLLFVGRLEKVKGLDILLKALAEVKDDIGNWDLRIVGNGTEIEKLEKLTADLEIAGKVIFLGQKVGEALKKEYDNADLFILPSLSEGQPVTLLDAWNHQLPVLVTDVGHNPFTVEDGVDGFLVTTGKIEALKQGIIRALTVRDQWHRMGIKGYEKAKQQYAWDKIAQRTYEVYQSLVYKS